MKSAVMPRIAKMIDTPEFEGHKRLVAHKAHCDQKTAGRILCSMWMEGLIYIKGWQREHGSPIPIYRKRTNGEKDAPKPAPLPQHANRDPVKHAAVQRMDRIKKKALSGDVRLGVWGL
jgi:hypothetical protein